VADQDRLRATAGSPLARRMRARGDLVIGTRPRDIARAGITMAPRLVQGEGSTVRFEDARRLRVAAVVWATGYRSDYGWLDVPGVIDEGGRLLHVRGLTGAPGLAFLGLPWQHTRGSALLGFVGQDAAWLAYRLAG
jgi:putative flavoprotein involved in K+ transport